MSPWYQDWHRTNAGYWKSLIGYKHFDERSYIPALTKENLKYAAMIFQYWDCCITDFYEIASDTSKHYKTYYVDKRNGSKRRIDSPDEVLKNIQKWILEDILYALPCSNYAKAFVPGRSIADNAKFHRNQKVVLTLDVKDFFPSIKEKHIFRIFNQTCQYDQAVAMILTKLCTCQGSLPQGAPTSACLSNLVMKDFDETLGQYCQDRNICFTRYADDMTFSGDFDIAALLYFVDQQLYQVGLTRHPEKLKIMRQHDRQQTTGIVVNNSLQAPREYRMKIRQEVHYIKTYGLDSHVQKIGQEKMHYLQSLLGRINYVLSINPKDETMKGYFKYVDALKTLELYK